MTFYALLKLFTFFVIFPNSYADNFRNYTLYNVEPRNIEDIEWLQILNNDVEYDFWNNPLPNSETVDVLASPKKKSQLEGFLKEHQIPYKVSIPDLQSEIEKEKITRYEKGDSRNFAWDGYYDLESIYNWLDDLEREYDEVTTVIGGSTYEDREIKGIKISYGSGRRAIFIESGIHSREWIAPATATYIANELLTSEDEETRNAARNYDWYIFPVVNPDGYEWTFTSYRLWRKNRRPFGDHFGVDLNRNWNSNWLSNGSSTNPSSDIFAGSGPFSEIETRSLSNYISSIAADIELYLSFHSYGQLLLLPFGNTTEPLANYADAISIGRRAMGALSVRYGTRYIAGNIAEAIYAATGGSIDWAKEFLNIPLVYCYELRGTSFILDSEQIIPNNEEVMESILEIIHQGKRFGYFNSSSKTAVSMISIFIASFAAYLLK